MYGTVYRVDKRSSGSTGRPAVRKAFGRLSDGFRMFSDAFGRLSDGFRMISDAFGRLSDGFRTAFGPFRTGFGRLLAIVDGFSLSWTAFSYRERRFAPPIPVFFFIFFFGPKGQKKKCMKHNWRMVDKRGVRSSRRRFDHPAGVSIIPQAFPTKQLGFNTFI